MIFYLLLQNNDINIKNKLEDIFSHSFYIGIPLIKKTG